MSDKKEIKACIAFLETNPKIEYNPYPCYGELLRLLKRLLEIVESF